MARKIIMLVRRDKKGSSRKIIALTPKFTSDPNFSSVSFRPYFISSFLDVLSLFFFYFEGVSRLLTPEEATFLIKLSTDLTSI